MKAARKVHGFRPNGKSLHHAMGWFLTPEVWKQVRKKGTSRRIPRWDVYALVNVALLMTWCCGDSLPEKWEAARAHYVITRPSRRRPGSTFEGFQKALRRLPMPVLRCVADALRGQIQRWMESRLQVNGFIPLGCDGSRLETPRTEELEKRLGTFGKNGAAPMIWITALVHLTSGIPWAWRFGRGGKASERDHLIQMINLLPAMAFIVADAGYVGFELIQTLMGAKVFFLIRMSSQASFYTDGDVDLETFREGIVYYWPKQRKERGKEPLKGRLIRVRSKEKKDVWLFTNVEDPQQLSFELAATFYRWRWENEGFFRTYKRTLSKVKLMSRTVRLIHREAEVSMIATQLLLCMGAQAMPHSQPKEIILCSPRKILLEIRKELQRPESSRTPFVDRIRDCERERRERIVPKQKRPWPRRKVHKPPQAPNLLRLTEHDKLWLQNYFTAT